MNTRYRQILWSNYRLEHLRHLLEQNSFFFFLMLKGSLSKILGQICIFTLSELSLLTRLTRLLFSKL